ncbi:MAG: LptF/LptG family permease [Marivibrio sp.]|uniref:LptF/LptG family permease n=1 Tax=Marivibrio sp. TaxID=2039719 RepID=UPI0032EFA6DE
MRRVTLYMSQQIAAVTLFATVVLCVAVLLVQSVRLIDLIVNRGVGLSQFGYMASLMVPRFVALVMPIALFGATLFSYNRMINDSELVVLRSAGLSTWSLARPALIVAVAASAVCYAMTLYMMPAAAKELRFHLEETRSQWGAALLQEGKFTNVGDEVTIFVRERTGSGELQGILYHSQAAGETAFTVIAERGAVVETEQGPRIVVLNGTRQSFEDGRMHLVRFDRSTIDLGGDRKASENYWDQPEERFLPRLLYPSETDPNDVYYRPKLIAEGHGRLVLPILPITYAALALAFMLRAQFSRRGNLGGVLCAVGVMTVVLIGHLSLLNAAGRNLDLLPALWANALAPLLIALAVLYKPRKHKRRAPPPETAEPLGQPAE